MRPIVCVSGGFDPVTIGHVRMIKAAAKIGDVVVLLNSDAWLMRKKGYVFMPFIQRAEIMKEIKGVLCIESVNDSDDTVCEALRRIQPDYFANGGDRIERNTPERATCDALGIKMLYGVGGDKIASSSELVNAAIQKA